MVIPMVEYNRILILILMFIIGIFAGFCLYAVMFAPSPHPVKQVLFTESAPAPVGPLQPGGPIGGFCIYFRTDRSGPGDRQPLRDNGKPDGEGNG